MAERLRLITFAPMIASEAARLVLAHHRVPYTEERHVFFWASLVALRRGGTVLIPLLYGDGPALGHVHQLAERFDAGSARPLIPVDPALRAAVLADYDAFLYDLANAVAKIAYAALLPKRDLALPVFVEGVPPAEARALARHYGAFARVMGKLLRLTADQVSTANTRLRAQVRAIDARLADGRRWLHGDTPTLADLTLAAAMGPLVLPRGSGSPIPPLAVTPPVLAALVSEMRSTVTGVWVSRVYDTFTETAGRS